MIYKNVSVEEQVEYPSTVWELCLKLLDMGDASDRSKEHLWGIGLDVRRNVEYVELISLGTLHRTAVSPQEVFRLPVQKGIHALILAHNHPSKGKPEPSEADKRMTRRIAAGAELWGFTLRDHVLVSNEGYYSMGTQQPELFEEAQESVRKLFAGK